MKISELSRATGVPVATVKFYLRDGLLPAGRATSATQAEYDETHVRRLRLVRALVEIGRLPLASVREVLTSLDDVGGMAAIGRAHDALPPGAEHTGPTPRATAAIERLGWLVNPDASYVHRLEAALEALEGVGMVPREEFLGRYAEAALAAARADVETVPVSSTADVVEWVLVGTVLYEEVLLSLRRMAQQHLFRSTRPDG